MKTGVSGEGAAHPGLRLPAIAIAGSLPAVYPLMPFEHEKDRIGQHRQQLGSPPYDEIGFAQFARELALGHDRPVIVRRSAAM